MSPRHGGKPIIVRSSALLCLTLMVTGLITKGSHPEGLAQTQQSYPPARRGDDFQLPPDASSVFALHGTAPLSLPLPKDNLERQRQQIIRYFLRQIAATPAKRDKLWQPNYSSHRAYQESLEVHRDHLRKMLGLIRPAHRAPRIESLQESGGARMEQVSLPIDTGFDVQVLLFRPEHGRAEGAVIAIPPATESSGDFAGITQHGEPAEWLRELLARHIVIAIPVMVERIKDHPLCQVAGGKDRRHILWRAGFIVGRALVGIEVQQVLAVRSFLASQPGIDPGKIAVLGERQGGMTALYAAAVDEHLAAAGVVDYFQQRENCWQEPVDRVLYGQLNEFGDAEMAALIAPRPLIVVTSSGGPVSPASVRTEGARADRFYCGLRESNRLAFISTPTVEPFDTAAQRLATSLEAGEANGQARFSFSISPAQIAKIQNQHFVMLYHYLRGLDAASDQVRKNFWKLDSTPPQGRLRKGAKIRSTLAHLMGVMRDGAVPMDPRTALAGETDKFLAYDVFLNVVPGVEAYGQLLVPRAVAGHMDKRLPAVICQHGFNGAPKYITGIGTGGFESNDQYYHRFGERLAERGYVVFAPYMAVPLGGPHDSGADLVNPLVRLAACLGLMRTSIELAKLRRVVDFLQSLPFVDPDRIGYYGMSYGGYSAMWMVPLAPRLKFSVVSAYFNDLRFELTDTTLPGHSFWTAPDEDVYNWNVLNRFSHTELIASMYPRPVAIEWGLHDPVTPPPWHRRAWKQVKAYAVAWGMDGKIEDDDYIGGHTTHGIQTFLFIDRWLRPERSAGREYGCQDSHYCNETLAPDLHGYLPSSLNAVPYATQRLDSDGKSAIRGRFYVSDLSPTFIGMAFKISRVGTPGDFIARFGSQPSKRDIGGAKIPAKEVYPGYDLWYEAKLKVPVRLDPKQIYYFEITAEPNRTPQSYYLVYGPKPLGGVDYPATFGLSFRTLTTGGK